MLAIGDKDDDVWVCIGVLLLMLLLWPTTIHVFDGESVSSLMHVVFAWVSVNWGEGGGVLLVVTPGMCILLWKLLLECVPHHLKRGPLSECLTLRWYHRKISVKTQTNLGKIRSWNTRKSTINYFQVSRIGRFVIDKKCFEYYDAKTPMMMLIDISNHDSHSVFLICVKTCRNLFITYIFLMSNLHIGICKM